MDKYLFSLDNKESFINTLYNKSINMKYQLIIIYSLKERKSNQLLYKYLTFQKPSNFIWSYTDTLYTNIDKLPSAYPEIYSKVYPKIINFLKIQQCHNSEEAKKILDTEKNEINTDLNNFYPTNKNKEFYINQLLNLQDKKIDIKKNEDLFINIPFEIFDFYEVDDEKGKIILKIKSPNIHDVLENISDNSILEIITIPLFNKLNDSIKGGLVERAIIQIIKNNNSPFGKFNNVFSIDCIKKKKKNKSYDFNKDETEKKITNLKYYKELTCKYSNFNYNGENILFVPFLSNAKEWDLAFITRNEKGEIELCLIQMSINKPVYKIQKMLTNFANKKNYIKDKIKIIYKIEIKYVNILFILSKQFQDKETTDFLDKFQIPYIYFNNENETQNFLYANSTNLKEFKLGFEHRYSSNKTMIDQCLAYKAKSHSKKENSFVEEIINSDEDEEISETSLTVSDILNNQFQDGKIN